LDGRESYPLTLLSFFLLLCIYLSFPPSSAPESFISWLIIHRDYFSLNCTEKAGYLYCSGGDEKLNEAGGRLLNKLTIPIIDLIVRNNKEKVFCPS